MCSPRSSRRGQAVDEVVRAARPPIFFKQEDSFRRQLGAVERGAAARRSSTASPKPNST